MTTTEATPTTTTQHGGFMVRSSFFVVEYVSASGSTEYSRTFATKRVATKWAREFSRIATTRVMQGGPGGMEVARFEKQ